MQKNVAGQKWVVFAFDRTDNTPKTGDAGNITAKISKDGAAAGATDDTNPTERESGYYVFDLTQAETNADSLAIVPVSATGDIQVIGVPGAVYTSHDIGAAGVSLSSIPWNAAWDAEVQSECADAITAAGVSTHDAAAVKTAIEAGGSHLALIKAVTDALTTAAAGKLATSAGTMVTGTVSHDNTAASTTVFYADDITEATADHYNGRIVIFISGDLQYQATDITDYELSAGEGKFTVTALTEAPADNVTFIIV